MNVGVYARAILAVLALGSFLPDRATAQGTSAVTGVVVDSVTRQPITGVQVSVVGTSRGAVTDTAGRYAMRNLSPGNLLVRAQRIGYGRADVRVVVGAGQTANVDFALSAVAAALSEVVVTGYGTDNRRSVTSAIARVDSSAITNNPVAGVDAALQGKAAGLQVIQNSGNPGVGITVRVRGASSLSANNQPLYVIDGIPMLRETYSQLGVGGQDITAVTGISPDEIESIDILKDASSAAIYGSRGSNGVIQITTKRGKAGQRRFSFNIFFDL